MKRPVIPIVAALLLVVAGALAWRLARTTNGSAAANPLSPAAADRMDKKLAQIQKNSALKSRAPLVTTFTEEEINSYFLFRMGSKVPKGVSNVRFTLHKDRVLGTATVDFETVKASQKKPVNPLLDFLLSGTKPVAGAGTFTSRDGSGLFHLEEVSIGSTKLSGFLLDLLIRHFVQPRYPQAAIDRPFALPEHLDRLVLEEGRVVAYQK